MAKVGGIILPRHHRRARGIPSPRAVRTTSRRRDRRDPLSEVIRSMAQRLRHRGIAGCLTFHTRSLPLLRIIPAVTVGTAVRLSVAAAQGTACRPHLGKSNTGTARRRFRRKGSPDNHRWRRPRHTTLEAAHTADPTALGAAGLTALAAAYGAAATMPPCLAVLPATAPTAPMVAAKAVPTAVRLPMVATARAAAASAPQLSLARLHMVAAAGAAAASASQLTLARVHMAATAAALALQLTLARLPMAATAAAPASQLTHAAALA